MNNKVLKLFYICLAFVFFMSLLSFNDNKVVRASSEEVYGEVSIDEIYHFNLTYGISPLKSFAPGAIGQMARDTKSAFAFNLPEEIETIVSEFREVKVKYKVCESEIVSFSYGFSVCYKQSDDYIVEDLSINEQIDAYYNKNFLDWVFGGKREAEDISKVGLIDDLINYEYKNYLNPLATVNNEINDYKYYGVMNEQKTYSSAIIEIKYLDLDGVEHTDECIIDPETGACIIQEDTESISDILDKIMQAFKWITNNIDYLIFVGIALLAVIFAPGLLLLLVFIFKAVVKTISLILKILFLPLTLVIKRKKRKKKKLQQKELIRKEFKNLKESEDKNGNI